MNIAWLGLTMFRVCSKLNSNLSVDRSRHLSVYRSLYLPTDLSNYLSIYPACLSIYRSISLPTYLPTDLPTYLPTYLCVYPANLYPQALKKASGAQTGTGQLSSFVPSESLGAA